LFAFCRRRRRSSNIILPVQGHIFPDYFGDIGHGQLNTHRNIKRLGWFSRLTENPRIGGSIPPRV
jgi:hypothetical protein